MSIVIPIMFFAVGVGLFVPRMTRGWWILIGVWITLILIYNYFKPLPVAIPNQQRLGLLRNRDVLQNRQG